MAMLPDEPPTFRPSSAQPRAWHWRLQNSAGEEVSVGGDLARRRSPARPTPSPGWGSSDAELAEQGVDSVTLVEVDRVVYGPMSLHPS